MLSHSQRQDSSSSSSTAHIPIPGRGNGLPKSASQVQFLQDQAVAQEREAAFAARLIQGLSLSMMQHSSSPSFCCQTQDCVNHILQARQQQDIQQEQRDYVWQVTSQVLAELNDNDSSSKEDDEKDDDDVMFALDF